MKRILLVLLLAGCASSTEPPSRSYGSSRTSTSWIEIPMGKIPVDEGVEWQGVKVYLSMMDILIGVDARTGKVLWNMDVGAFWNRIGFREIDKVWAVELRPRPSEREGSDLVQYHDLRTGKLVERAEPGNERGISLTARKQWNGAESRLAEPFCLIASTTDAWKDCTTRMFQEAPALEPVDFDREMVLVVSDGDSVNCRGISIREMDENDHRIRIRVRHHYYQTFHLKDEPVPERPLERPYGLFVLPRRSNKPIVVEYNMQRYIGGPPIWKERHRVTLQ